MRGQVASGESALLKANQYKKKSQWLDIWRRLRKNKGSMAGLVILVIIVLLAIFADFIFDYDLDVIGLNMARRLQWPSSENLLGTDELGRDMLARVVFGARTSLAIGAVCNLFAFTGGVTLGAIAGFYGGKTDNIIMRFTDIFLAIPGQLLAICIVAALGISTGNLILALSVAFIPGYARVMRGPVLMIRDVEFIEAARAIGARKRTIIMSHVLPNCMAPVIVQAALNMAWMIVMLAGLSFLGLGISPPTPEWGAMLSSSRDFIRDNSYMALFPGIAIMLTVLSLNLLGDGLRDALDPRLK